MSATNDPPALSDDLSASRSLDETKLQLESMQLAEAIQQNQRSSKLNETLIVNNLVGFFNPLIAELDENVNSLRISQCDLTNQIKTLLNDIGNIYEDEKAKLDLDEYTKRLLAAKKRVNNVQATIMSVQDRLNRIFVSINKDPLLQQAQASEASKDEPKS